MIASRKANEDIAQEWLKEAVRPAFEGLTNWYEDYDAFSADHWMDLPWTPLDGIDVIQKILLNPNFDKFAGYLKDYFDVDIEAWLIESYEKWLEQLS